MRKTIVMALAVVTVVVPAAAVAMIGPGGPGSPAAQEQEQGVATLGPIVVGLVRGQELRVSVGLPPGSRCEGRGLPQADVSGVEYFYQVVAVNGNPLFQSDQIAVPEGGFGTDKVDRDDLRPPGEEGTGRLQVGVWMKVSCDRGGRVPDGITATLEGVDTDTGGGPWMEAQVSFPPLPPTP